MLIAAGVLPAGCESWPPASGAAPWPGADRAAYDDMNLRTRCRTTLSAPDCRVSPPVPAGGPAPVNQAPGSPVLVSPAPVSLAPPAAR
ncbi:hypothetical protein DKG75_05175 [Zavarzinia compransoris]|uniref:Uncharacterized protein n=1 Tax=Zavarzinia compransoris TaxID=1264899 RepID=A0A317EEZ1_9PROT|nr:hypothetical protein DKG75_05175 [Zavarzinia compransoris]